MDRRQKVELFEQIRREYEFGEGTIAGVARQFGVHRRLVRQALASAVPPQRKRSPRACPRLSPVRDGVLPISLTLLANSTSGQHRRHHAGKG